MGQNHDNILERYVVETLDQISQKDRLLQNIGRNGWYFYVSACNLKKKKGKHNFKRKKEREYVYQFVLQRKWKNMRKSLNPLQSRGKTKEYTSPSSPLWFLHFVHFPLMSPFPISNARGLLFQLFSPFYILFCLMGFIFVLEKIHRPTVGPSINNLFSFKTYDPLIYGFDQISLR